MKSFVALLIFKTFSKKSRFIYSTLICSLLTLCLLISSLHTAGYRYDQVYRFIVKNYEQIDFRNFSMPLNRVRIREWISVPEDTEDDWSVAVYDVFYDLRINKTVIFGASRIAEMKEKFGYIMYKYTCAYFNANGDFISVVTASFYTSYMVYCDPPDHLKKLPRYVTLIREDSGVRPPKWMMPIRVVSDPPTNTNYEQEFALCVGIIFANQPWLTLLQFFEFHLAQGIQKFYVFYYDLRNEVTKQILSYYVQNYPGSIDLIEWTPKTQFCGHYWCQLMRDNYCLYSNIGRHRYLGFVDIDELLYPVDASNTTLLQLLRNTDRSYIGSFVFRVQWHQTLRYICPFWHRVDASRARKVVTSYLPFLKFNNVSTLAHELYSPKTIVKPEKVLRKWIHFVREHTPNSMYYFMNETQAYLMHFKIRTWWGVYADHAEKVVNFTIVDPYDTFDRTFMTSLTERVIKAVVEIKRKV